MTLCVVLLSVLCFTFLLRCARLSVLVDVAAVVVIIIIINIRYCYYYLRWNEKLKAPVSGVVRYGAGPVYYLLLLLLLGEN